MKVTSLLVLTSVSPIVGLFVNVTVYGVLAPLMRKLASSEVVLGATPPLHFVPSLKFPLTRANQLAASQCAAVAPIAALTAVARTVREAPLPRDPPVPDLRIC